MRLLVAITDSKWFDYLAELRPDEVNFWQPSGSGSFQALSPGEPLLFKLHSPNDFIVGGGNTDNKPMETVPPKPDQSKA